MMTPRPNTVRYRLTANPPGWCFAATGSARPLTRDTLNMLRPMLHHKTVRHVPAGYNAVGFLCLDEARYRGLLHGER